MPDGPAGAEADSDAREEYLAACTDYLKRQLLVYRNWPQRRYNEMGYLDEVVFTDQNA